MAKRKPLFAPAKPVFTFRSQCQFKRPFSKREAQEWAERYGQRVYRCVHCGKRHLTSKAKP